MKYYLGLLHMFSTLSGFLIGLAVALIALNLEEARRPMLARFAFRNNDPIYALLLLGLLCALGSLTFRVMIRTKYRALKDELQQIQAKRNVPSASASV